MKLHTTTTFLAILLLAGATAAFAKGGKGKADKADAQAIGIEESDHALALGRAAFEDGLYDMAEEKLSAVLEHATDRHRRDEATVWLARIWLAQGKADEALQALDRLTKGELKDNALLAEARYTEIDALAQAQKLDEAFALLREFDHPRADVLAWGIDAAIRNGRLDDALAFYGKRTAASPQAVGPATALALAEALLDARRDDDAQMIAADLQALDNPHPWTDRFTTKKLIRDIDVNADGAIEALKAWAADGTVPADQARLAWRRLAQAYADKNNLDAAIDAAHHAQDLAAVTPEHLQDRLLLAQLQLRTGQLHEAAQTMRTLATEWPDADEAARLQRELVLAMLEAGDYDGTLAESRHWLDAFEGRDGTDDIRIARAEAFAALGRLNEAADTWQSLLRAAAPNAENARDLYRRAADTLFDAKRMNEAQTAYERLLDLVGADSPEGLDIRLRLAEIALQTKQNDSDGELLLQEIARSTDVPEKAWDATMRLGRLYEARGADELAADQYSAIADADPTAAAPPSDALRAEALLARGHVRHRLGDNADALDDFGRILDTYADLPVALEAQYMQAWCFHAVGRAAEAEAAAAALLEKDGIGEWAPRTRFLLAERAFNRGDFAQATNQFVRLALDHPDSPLAPDALYWAGRAAIEQHSYLAANELFNTLVKHYPDAPRTAAGLLAQGDARSELGQFEGAIQSFDEIIQRFDASDCYLAAWGRKGDAQYTLGENNPARYEEARMSYGRLLEIPSAPAELRLQASYKIGRCLEKSGRAADAITQYMATAYDYLQQDGLPAEASVWFTRSAFAAAALQEQAGNWREAIGIYRRVATSGVAASNEATVRIRRLQEDHWYQLRPGEEEFAPSEEPAP